MSGAFNIDIEVGKGSGEQKIRIYCASLTDTWDVEVDAIKLASFHTNLQKEPAIVKNKINLGQCPKVDNINACELFLSRLGCTAAVLRIARFHEFLGVPKSVRDGLTYASHKPFGKVQREGSMQRHPRFVRRGGGKRWIRLTKDERGGSLICYLDEHNKNSIISSLKIGASTEMQNLKDKGIPNAFVLKSGKRQWVLQATSSREYTQWQSKLLAMLKEFGPVNLNTSSPQSASVSPSASPRASGAASPRGGKGQAQQQGNPNTGRLVKENAELTEKVAEMKRKIARLKEDIEKYTDIELEAKSREAEERRKAQKQFQRRKEDLIAEYEVKQDNLRQEIEALHQKLEQKTADEAGRSGLKTLFGEDFVSIDLQELQEAGGERSDRLLAGAEDDDDEEPSVGSPGGGGRVKSALEDDEDDEAASLNEYAGTGDSNIKYLHKHKHRHDHKHIHDHRHTHIHDQTGDEPVTYTHTHTIAHTITHTMTLFKVKKASTFG